jgi:hypothetical protein
MIPALAWWTQRVSAFAPIRLIRVGERKLKSKPENAEPGPHRLY